MCSLTTECVSSSRTAIELDEVLFAVDDPQHAISVHDSYVSGMKPNAREHIL